MYDSRKREQTSDPSHPDGSGLDIWSWTDLPSQNGMVEPLIELAYLPDLLHSPSYSHVHRSIDAVHNDREQGLARRGHPRNMWLICHCSHLNPLDLYAREQIEHIRAPSSLLIYICAGNSVFTLYIAILRISRMLYIAIKFGTTVT